MGHRAGDYCLVPEAWRKTRNGWAEMARRPPNNDYFHLSLAFVFQKQGEISPDFRSDQDCHGFNLFPVLASGFFASG